MHQGAVWKMRGAVLILVVAALGGVGALAQTSPEELSLMHSELKVQVDIADSTRWMMWTGIASAVFAFLGFIGVMFTLREQRLLATSLERAVLLVDECEIEFAPTEGHAEQFKVTYSLRNVGRTRADKVQIEVSAAEMSRVGKQRQRTRINFGQHQLSRYVDEDGAVTGTTEIATTITPRQLARMKRWDGYTVLVRFTYHDVFGQMHRQENWMSVPGVAPA